MRNIYRYTLRMTDLNEVMMPRGAQILSVQIREDSRDDPMANPQLWALVDTTQPNVTRTIGIHGTGHDMDRWLALYPAFKFISTFQVFGGRLVFHAFDYGERGYEATNSDQSAAVQQNAEANVASGVRRTLRGVRNRG